MTQVYIADLTTPALEYVFDPGSSISGAEQACPYIPALRAAVAGSLPDPSTACNAANVDTVKQVQTASAENFAAIVTVPPGSADPLLPTSGNPQATTLAVVLAHSVNGARPEGRTAQCTLPDTQRDVCVAALDLFVQQVTQPNGVSRPIFDGPDAGAAAAAVRSAVAGLTAGVPPPGGTASGSPGAPSAPPAGSMSGMLLYERAGGRPSGIGLVAPDGTGNRLIDVSGADCCADAVLSPNGVTVAMAAGSTVQVSNIDGTGHRSISTAAGGEILSLAWSPDGNSIAFAMRDPAAAADLPPTCTIMAMRPDGTSAHPVAHGVNIHALAWSPDGAQIAFLQNQGGIWIVPATGGPTHMLPTADTELPADLSWAPSTSILYAELGRDPAGIWEMNSDGSAARSVLPGGASPSWGPDGTHFAAVLGGRVAVADTDGGARTLEVTDAARVRWAAPAAVRRANRYAFRATLGQSSPAGAVVARVPRRDWPSGAAGDRVQVAWGDGSVTPASFSDSGDQVVVSAQHVYRRPGHQQAAVVVTSAGDKRTVIPVDVTVASTYVAMGDSYSAGEGAHFPALSGCHSPVYDDDHSPANKSTDYVPGEICESAGGLQVVNTGDSGNVCHRASTAYPHVASDLLGVPGLTLTFVACSGATIDKAWKAWGSETEDKEHKHKGEAEQLKPLDSSTSLVTLTFGGNDINFSDVVKRCVSPIIEDFGTCVGWDGQGLIQLGYDARREEAGKFYFSEQGAPLPTSPPSDSTLGGLSVHDRLVLVLRMVKARAPFARILVLGYPRWFGPSPSPAEHYSALEEQWLNDRLFLFDKVISDAVEESGVAEYVDNYDSFAGHELDAGSPATAPDCGTGSYINGIDLVAGAMLSAELMHPNPCGHKVWGRLIADAYRADDKAPSFEDQLVSLIQLGANGVHGATSVSNSHFAVSSGGMAARSITVPPGVERLDVSTTWASGTLGARLSGPGHWDQNCVAPTAPAQHSPCTEATSPDGYLVWTVWHPAAGTWHLTVQEENPSSDSGTVNGDWRVSFGGDLPVMPPESYVQADRYDTSFLGQRASVLLHAHPDSASPQLMYSWYDDNGEPQLDVRGPLNELLDGQTYHPGHLRVVLKTSEGDSYRYDLFCDKFDPECQIPTGLPLG